MTTRDSRFCGNDMVWYEKVTTTLDYQLDSNDEFLDK